MSIIEPKIDTLLDNTDQDRFLLCALASKRAQDVNDMMRGQRSRAIELDTAVDIAKANKRRPLSIAFDEIAKGDVSFDESTIDINNH
ncbi:MAG: DNA-directed RNA polymerase subunit omega [Anaerotardibacter sp.]